jgi:Rrf2 family protein
VFGQTVEYALRATLQLARTHDHAQTTRQIAETMKVPPSYLAKVMQSLVRARIVHSQRGAGGGFVLARHPDVVDLLEIVDAVGPLKRIESCPLQMEEHHLELCPLHRRLDEAIGNVRQAFSTTTLGELLREPQGCEGIKARD